MKTLIIIGIILSATIAQSQTRDSISVVDSTATAVSLSMSFSAEESAALHRVFGVAWRQELRSHINHVIISRDPRRDEIELWNKLQAPALTAAERTKALNALRIKDPRTIELQRTIKARE